MALTESLELLINADPSQGIAAMRGFASEADKSLSTVEGRLAKFSSAALKIGAGGIGVGGLLTQMASGDIEAQNQLQAAISATGQSISDYQDRIDKAVDSSAKFGHTDEQVNQALTKLVASYGDTGAALDQMQLAEDLAAFKHIGLADAASLVARAHGGAGRIFKEFGVEVKTNTDGTKDYDGALRQVADRLSGQASAAADSWGGKLRELSARAENFVSELGQNFGPAILGISTGLTALGGITSVVQAGLARQATAHAAAAAAAEAQAVADTELAASEALVTGNTAASVATLYELTEAEAAATAGAGGLSTGLLGVVAALGPLAIGAGIGAGLLAVFGDGTTDATKKAKELAAAGNDDLLPMFDRLDRFDQLKVIGTLIDEGDQGAAVLTRLRDAAAAAGQPTEQYDHAIEQAAAHQQELNASNPAAGLAASAQAASTAAESAKSLATWYDTIAKNADKAAEAALRLAPADIQVRQGALTIRSDQEDVAAAEAKVRFLKAAGASTEEVADAERDLESARLELESATLRQAEAQTELARTQAEANGKTLEGEAASRFQLGTLGLLASQMDGPVADALSRYIFLETVAINKTYDLAAAQSAVNQGKTINDLGDTSSHNIAGARAGGGSVYAGQSYLVGEHQPEIFTPDSAGWIWPSVGDFMAASSQGAGSAPAPNHNEFIIVHPDALAAADETARTLNRQRYLQAV